MYDALLTQPCYFSVCEPLCLEEDTLHRVWVRACVHACVCVWVCVCGCMHHNAYILSEAHDSVSTVYITQFMCVRVLGRVFQTAP